MQQLAHGVQRSTRSCCPIGYISSLVLKQAVARVEKVVPATVRIHRHVPAVASAIPRCGRINPNPCDPLRFPLESD